MKRKKTRSQRPGSLRSTHRNISVRGVRRPVPDLKKLATALLMLAEAQQTSEDASEPLEPPKPV